MAERKAGLMRVDYEFKFESIQDAEKEANRIVEHVRRKAEQKAYAVTLFIGISENNGEKGEFKMIDRKGVSRREKKFFPYNDNEDGKVEPHLHIMFLACPCHTVADLIVSCINNRMRKLGLDGKATKQHCDIKYARYIGKQSRKVRIVDYDSDNILNTKYKAEFKNLKEKNCGNASRKIGIKKPRKPSYSNEESSFIAPVCNPHPAGASCEARAERVGIGRKEDMSKENEWGIEIRVRQGAVISINMNECIGGLNFTIKPPS